MDWKTTILGFKSFLELEKSASDNTVEAYINDVNKFSSHIYSSRMLNPTEIKKNDIIDYFTILRDLGIQASTQARILSSIKQFYKYCFLENLITQDPTELISSPKKIRKLPDVLSVEDIDKLLLSIDHSTNIGMRNRAIIETLYGCGLRVSELCSLQLSKIIWDEDIVRILGKGNKERLVPIGLESKKYIQIYVDECRSKAKVKPKFTDIVFLNNRGGKLHRVMIFLIVKSLAKKAGISQNISPHSFRHSYATHLIERGADIRIVQQLLGHESITTTEIYTHTSISHLRKVLDKYHPSFG